MTETTEVNKGGRPSLFSEELAERIAERLASGQTFKQITDDPAMPSLRTVMRWAREKEGFGKMLLNARDAQVETLVGIMWEEALKADDNTVQSARLRVNVVQWLLSRYAPKQFSERVIAELAKLPEPVKQKEPDIDPNLLSYEERELYLQLVDVAKRRRENLMLEHVDAEEIEEEEGEIIEYEYESEAGTADAGSSDTEGR